MGVGRGIPCGFFFAAQTVGLLAQPLDAAREADPVVGGEGNIRVQHPVVACFVFDVV